jgi:hypothetical protein
MTHSKSCKALNVSALSLCDQRRLKEVRASNPVYHVGKQWAVTGYGIEELRSYAGHRPYYHIAKRDLSGMWPRHMAEKNWVDSADFNRAFTVAIQVHNVDCARHD